MGDFLDPIDFGSLSVHSLSAGYYHTCALADQPGKTGSVVCWGANDKGQVTLLAIDNPLCPSGG